jgi:tetratricopeptide (TPR) repeat protein
VDGAWIGLAEDYIYSGNIDEAFRAFEATRQHNIKMGNRRILGIDLSWESLAVSRYGNLEYALRLRQWSLELAVEAGNHNTIAWHTWEEGEIYRLMKDIEHARQYYEEALPQFEQQKDFLGLGFYHRGNGEIAMMLGRWEDARREFELALEAHRGEQRALRNWGQIYYHARLGSIMVSLNKISEAKEQLNTSLTIAKSWPYPDVKALPLIGLASLLAAIGNTTEAVEIAACVASRTTTWNEVKGHAHAIIEAAKKVLLDEEIMEAQKRGEGFEIDQLIQTSLESPYLK